MEDTKYVDDEVSQDPEVTEVEEVKLDWREAGKKLKEAVEKNKDDFSIDTYFIKIKVDELRERYNDKERTAGLHGEIMAL